MATKKRVFKKYNVRSGWPTSLKADCDYFNITFTQLADESNISRYRISAIANICVVYKTTVARMEEYTRLTEAFNRIIADRNRKCKPSAWEW